MSQYAATAAFFGTLVGHGLTNVVVSPGLRSVPLSLTAHATPGLNLTVEHDERVGGFVALGMAAASGRPVAVVCTSGSALANLFPAVVEAHRSRIPLIVVTGDRPPELHGWDSPQTIDQRNIFGSFADVIEMPVGDETEPDHARRAASEAWLVSQQIPAGPIHVNWPFREPLEPTAPLHVEAEAVEPVLEAAPAEVPPEVVELIGTSTRGLIAAGKLSEAEAASVRELSRMTGWPVIADPMSGLRVPGAPAGIVTTADHYLMHAPWADEHVPDVVLRVGSPPTSKALRLWMERTRPKAVVVLDPAGHRRDPSRTMTHLVTADVAAVTRYVPGDGATDPAWLDSWRAADDVSRAVIDAVAAEGFEEAAATRVTAAGLPTGTNWHVASSTPIRDVDWYVDATMATITSNRGANGIDGTVSTGLGIAIGSGRPTVVTLGDVALTHDVGGVLAAGRSAAALTLVVYDNGGGGIFSLLPIVDAVDDAAFEEILHTPTALDLPSMASAAGLEYIRAGSSAELADALSAAEASRIVHVPLTVAGSAAQLRAVRREIAAAL